MREHRFSHPLNHTTASSIPRGLHGPQGEHGNLACFPRTRSHQSCNRRHTSTAWALFASLTCRPNGPSNTKCSAFLGVKSQSRTASPQTKSPVSGKRKFQGQRQKRETAPELCRPLAETFATPGSPPIAGICRLFGKSPRTWDCVVGLRGLELRASHAFCRNRSLTRPGQSDHRVARRAPPICRIPPRDLRLLTFDWTSRSGRACMRRRQDR